jgi:hypothetical protein
VHRPICATLVREASSSRRVRVCPSAAFCRLLGLSVFWTLLLAVAVGPARAQSQADEYRVKAAFLYHFAQLVDWPAQSQGDAGQPLILCTIGDDPFRGELETSVDGKVVDSRVIRIRHLKRIQDAHGCHILFFDKSQDQQLAEMLTELGNGPILTVGESDRFAQQGGMIQFILDDSKVRFSINVSAAQKSGLKISSKLLLLAKEVIGNRGGN